MNGSSQTVPPDADWRREAVPGNYAERPAFDPGDPIRISVNTNAQRYSLEVYRDGAHRQAMFRREGIPGTWSDTNINCSELGCNWPVSVIVSETESWRSGGFVIRAFVASDSDGVAAESKHVVIIGPTRNRG